MNILGIAVVPEGTVHYGTRETILLPPPLYPPLG
jgi:hypothetical protein